jgi:5-methylcytosine-specific restriction endonuclease McrA
MNSVIVLNFDYTYIGITSPEKAISWIVTGKVMVEKASDKFFRSVTTRIAIPVVVRLTNLVRKIHKRKIQWSKRNIMIRDNYTCTYCGDKDDLDIDHVLPSSQGGKNTWENCVTSCRTCNRKKRDRTPKEAGMFFRKGFVPYQPTVMEFIQLYQKKLGIDKILKSMGLYF